MKNPETRRLLIDRSVSTSSAVEGIKVDLKSTKTIEIPKHTDKKIYQK
jgi:hypothetical protein